MFLQLGFQKLTKSYRGKVVLDGITATIDAKARVGLVGRNGSGKTTLAKILAQEEPPDCGVVTFPDGGRIVYAEQLADFAHSSTVFKEVLAAAKDQRTACLALEKMHLGKELWKHKVVTLSGGEKTKLALCKVMVQDFDFLILDEPTCHLDLASLKVLEEYLLSLEQPQLLISHDRFFLDRLVTIIWELEDGKLKVFPGNYSAYKGQKEKEEKYFVRKYHKQQERIADLKQEIQERSTWFRSAHRQAGTHDYYRAKAKKHASRTKAKKRELARLEKEKLPAPEAEVAPTFELINKHFEARLPRELLHVKGLTKSYGGRSVFRNLNLTLERGERLALIGPNGSGKTTFLRMLMGLEKLQGEIVVNPQVKLGYLPQELDHLEAEATILEAVAGGESQEARMLLAALMFRGDAVEKKISSLSMGERGRVAFAQLILSGANVLLLDEPTNYLDLVSREKIENVLSQFQGSIIFVSHDRYSIQKLATKIAVLEEGELTLYPGGYDYYLEKSQRPASVDDADLKAEINRLQCELAYLGGKLSQCPEEEKIELDLEYQRSAGKLKALQARQGK